MLFCFLFENSNGTDGRTNRRTGKTRNEAYQDGRAVKLAL